MPQEDVINFKVEGATSKEKLKVGVVKISKLLWNIQEIIQKYK